MNRRPLWLSGLRLLLLGVIVVWSAFPILLVVTAAFRPETSIFSASPTLFFEPTLRNFETLVERWPEFFTTLGNSLIITLGATALTVAASTLAGYAYSRYRQRALTATSFFMIVVRMFPPIVISIPLFPVVNALALNDTHIVLILLYATFFVSLSSWIMKAFIDRIPRELEEAAAVDGAGLLQIFLRVTLPLSVHGMVASAVFVFVFSWNEFLFAFIFTSTRAKTAPLILSEMMSSVTGAEWGPLFAAATIQLVPAVIFIIAVQRYLVAGLSAGSVKG